MVAEEKLKKAKRELSKAQSKENKVLRVRGVAAREEERGRKRKLRPYEALAKKHVKKPVLGINTTIPPELLIPVRDP